MSKRDLYIKAQAPSTPVDEPWVRNPNWLPLDDVQPGDNKFSGLWAVYEDVPSTHWFNYQIGGSAPSLVDYGDGNTQEALNLLLYQYQYNYPTLPGPILVDDMGRNYKMVVINIRLTNVTTGLLLDRNGTNGYSSKENGWLDIIWDCASCSTFTIQDRPSFNLQRLRILNSNLNNFNSTFVRAINLRVLDVNFSAFTTSNFQSTFSQIFNGDYRNSNNEPISIINNTTTQFISTFSISHGLKRIGIISSTSATSTVSTFASCTALEEIEEFNVPNTTSTASLFNNCPRLRRIGAINVSGSMNASAMFQTCNNLEEIGPNNILNLPNCTTAVNGFFDCRNLKKITIIAPQLISPSAMFVRNYKLEEVNLVTAPSVSVTTSMFSQCFNLLAVDMGTTQIIGLANSMFVSCHKITDIRLGDCSLITNTSSMFASCLSLKKLRIPGMRIGLAINSTAIEAPEMVTVFNDLADLIALGLPTANINISGTPAAVNLTTAERNIALNKGWTITG